MNTVTSFLVAHRRTIAIVLAVCAGLFGAYALGKSQAEERVVIQEREVVKIQTVDRVIYKESSKTESRVDVKKQTNRVKDTHVIVRTDGTTETRVREEDRSSEAETRVEIQLVDRFVDRVVEVEKIVEKQVSVDSSKKLTDWRLSLDAGLFPLQALETQTLTLDQAMLGVRLDRRVLGPLSVGVFVQTTGVVGASLSLDF